MSFLDSICDFYSCTVRPASALRCAASLIFLLSESRESLRPMRSRGSPCAMDAWSMVLTVDADGDSDLGE